MTEQTNGRLSLRDVYDLVDKRFDRLETRLEMLDCRVDVLESRWVAIMGIRVLIVTVSAFLGAAAAVFVAVN